MKILKIAREDLIKGNYTKAKEEGGEQTENIDMGRELGDFLYRLLQHTNSKKEDGIGLLSSNLALRFSMNMSFVVRKKSLEEITREIYSMFTESFNRVRGLYSISEMTLIILEDGEQFVPPLEENIYDKTTYLKGADVA